MAYTLVRRDAPGTCAPTEIDNQRSGPLSMHSSNVELNPSDVFDDRFRIVRRLGEGAFGLVYEAEDLEVGRRVALKTIDTNTRIENLQQRFEREVEVIRALEHGNIVRLYAHGLAEGVLYMSMELVDGLELREVIEMEAPIEPNRAVRIALQMLDALAEAQAHGVVHRDLKPENIILTRKGVQTDVVKLLDFGIAKSVNAQATRLTATGLSCGTPLYMAPEQFMSKNVGPHTDIYAVGLILLEMLTGEPPVDGDTVYALIAEHMQHGVTIPPRIANGPLGPILARATAKSWRRRFPDAVSMHQALSGFITAETSAPAAPPAAAIRKPVRKRREATPAESAPTLVPVQKDDDVDTEVEKFFETQIKKFETGDINPDADMDTDDEGLVLDAEPRLESWMKEAVESARSGVIPIPIDVDPDANLETGDPMPGPESGDRPVSSARAFDHEPHKHTSQNAKPKSRNADAESASATQAGSEQTNPEKTDSKQDQHELPQRSPKSEDSHLLYMKAPPPQPIKERSPLLIVFILLLVAGAAGAGWYLTRDDTTASEPEGNGQAQAGDEVDENEASDPTDDSAATEDESASTSDADPIKVTLELHPRKATVILNGRRICSRSPCHLEWVPGTPGQLEVIKDGWQSRAVNLATIDVSAPVKIELDRL